MDDIRKKLEELEVRIVTLESLFSKPETKEVSKSLSIKEFILLKKPTSAVEKTLVIGFYLEKYKGLDSFNINDLEGAFQAAREPSPSNINDTVNKNIAKGLLMESKKKDNQKAWVVTNLGEQHVESIGTIEVKK